VLRYSDSSPPLDLGQIARQKPGVINKQPSNNIVVGYLGDNGLSLSSCSSAVTVFASLCRSLLEAGRDTSWNEHTQRGFRNNQVVWVARRDQRKKPHSVAKEVQYAAFI